MANDAWFYAKNGQQAGPVPFAELQRLAGTGEVTPADMIWTEGWPNWAPAGTVRELYPAGVAIPAAAYPQAPGQINYYTPPFQGPPTAGFWIRVCAAILDALCMFVVSFVIAIVLGLMLGVSGLADPTTTSNDPVAEGIVQLAGLICGWLYEALMTSSSTQATLGKMAVGLKVTGSSGERISFGRATGRHFAKFISGLIFGIGYIMVAFTDRNRGLHDMIAGTLVLKKDPTL